MQLDLTWRGVGGGVVGIAFGSSFGALLPELAADPLAEFPVLLGEIGADGKHG